MMIDALGADTTACSPRDGHSLCRDLQMPPTAKDYDKGFLMVAEQFNQMYDEQVRGIKEAMSR